MNTYYKPYVSDDSDGGSDSSGYTSEESLLNVPGKLPPVSTGGAVRLSEEPPKIPSAGTKFEPKESKNTTLFTINSRDRDTSIYPQPTFFTMRLPRTFKSVKTVNISQLNLLNSFFNFTQANSNTNMHVYEQGRTLPGTTLSNVINVEIPNGTYSAGDLVTALTNTLNATPLFADITLGDFINQFQATGNYSIEFNTPGPIVYNSLTNTYESNQTINDIVGRYFQTVQTVGTINYTYSQCLVAYYYPIIKEMIIKYNPNIPFDVSVVTYPSSTGLVPGSPPPGYYSWYEYLVFSFTGLDDPYVTSIVLSTSNQVIFNAYRAENTFNRSLVNQYNCTYNSLQGRLTITAPSLNPSIQNDLTTQYNSYLYSLAIQSGFSSVSDFQNQYAQISYSNGIIIELYNFIQSRFNSNFGVDFGLYTANFYSDSNNEIQINNTLNRYGWKVSLTPSVSEQTINSNAPPPAFSTLWPNIKFNKTITTTNAFISTLTVPSFGVGGELTFSNSGESQYGYTDISFSIVPTTYIRNSFTTRCRQNISLMTIPRYIDERGSNTDMVYDLGPSTFQTPLLYDLHAPGKVYIRTDISGYPSFNMYEVTQSMFMSADYMRAYNEWIVYIKPQFLSGLRVQAGDPNLASPPITDMALVSYRPYMFFQLNGDKYPAEPNARFDVTFYAETQDGSLFPVPIMITWYKDRAGFMADVPNTINGILKQQVGLENPRHYFKQMTFGADLSGAQMTVTINNNEQSYFIIELANAKDTVSSLPLRIFCILTGIYGDYTFATVEDRYDMPFSTLSSLEKQYTPNSAVYLESTKSIYDTAVFQLGYDVSGVSNNLLDYIIQQPASGNYYDPTNITNNIGGSNTGLVYQFSFSNSGARGPAVPTANNPIWQPWSLFFGANSSNIINDSYANKVYLSSLQTPKPLPSSMTNEYTLVNWYYSPNTFTEPYERFLIPDVNNASILTNAISTTSVFLPCLNSPSQLPSDVFPPAGYTDSNGICGMSFFLPPNQVVKLDSFLIKFAYTQPSTDNNLSNFSRNYSPIPYQGPLYTNLYYQNRATLVNTSNSGVDDWDDWYLYNRRNTKLGIFYTKDICGANISSLQLSNAVCTFTLNKVIQTNNYQNKVGTLRTREADWGTYYQYMFESNSVPLWDISTVQWTGPSTSTYWRSTMTTGDFAPTYLYGNSTVNDYFLTPPIINNYTYLPRSIGLAPAVGMADYDPTLISSYTSDIPNSFTIVPFYKDPATDNYTMGSFYGVSYTDMPAMPSSGLVGEAPYFGPPGPYAWSSDGSTIQLISSVGAQFYWNTKIHYETLDMRYNPATDLSSFGGYPGVQSEYQDTLLFFYENQLINEDYADVSTNIVAQSYWKWGQESNALYHDYNDQSGYNSLSYLNNISVRPTVPEYATHVRAYDPIPRFNTGLRFIGKNFTDFGTPTLWEIATEISSLAGYVPITNAVASQFITNLYTLTPFATINYGPYTSSISTNNGIRLGNGNYFSHEYADALINFDKTFSTSVLFGKLIGYPGVNFSFSGYSDCISQYVNLFSSTRSILTTYTTILSTATGELNTYVGERYGNILPSTVINRNRITDPLPFQLLFSTFLVEPYKSQYDQWGLGYNLGFNKRDTLPAVSVTSDTFIRIVQDYIYLQLNPEFNMNMLAVSGKEDKSMCLDSSAQESKYFSKIILNDFGSYCRTAVQMPKNFNPVLGKYETISCQLTDKNGVNISSIDCEYDFVLEITEILNGPSDNSSLLTTTADLDVYAGKNS